MIKEGTRFVKNNLPYIILVMMILGLVNGYFNGVSYLKVLITPVLFLMVYPMMINLNLARVFHHLSNPKPLLLSLIINFLISPGLAYVISKVFLAGHFELMMGLILISLIPTSGMTASWTGLAKGNMEMALIMISANLLLSILIIPVYLKLFLGQLVAINTVVIIKSLLKVVIIPLILGDLTRRFIISKYGERKFKEIKPNFGGISALGVAIIVFIALSLKSKIILGDLSLVLTAIIPLVVYYGLLLLISVSIGNRLLNYQDKIALIYGTQMRNLTVALGLTLNTFGGLAVFLIALAYIIQVPIGAFYMHIIKKKGMKL